ncbi:MAG: PIN domain-containing protein [Gemmataceae bacterium]
MNAVDSNVFIYRVDPSDPIKQAKAKALLKGLPRTSTVLLWQVLGEVTRFLRYWQDQGNITRAAFVRYATVVARFFPLALPTSAVFDEAISLSGRFSLSHWDSMLLGACKVAGVTTLYTEDMGAPTVVDGIQLINPF